MGMQSVCYDRSTSNRLLVCVHEEIDYDVSDTPGSRYRRWHCGDRA